MDRSEQISELFSGLDSGVDLKSKEEAVFKVDFQISWCHSLNKGELQEKEACGGKEHNGSEQVELNCP